LFDRVLPGNTSALLALLGQHKAIQEAYLAGGTALALQLGHRYSFDLDFFTPTPFDEKELINTIQSIGPFKLETLKWRTILGKFTDVKFSIFYYEYPLLFTPHQYNGIRIADAKDIAAMKIAAVADRGTKRDFIDLYIIAKNIVSLEEAIDLYEKKYHNLTQAAIHIHRALSYFDDAEQDDTPKMIERIKWPEVRAFFEQEAKKLARKLINK